MSATGTDVTKLSQVVTMYLHLCSDAAEGEALEGVVSGNIDFGIAVPLSLSATINELKQQAKASAPRGSLVAAIDVSETTVKRTVKSSGGSLVLRLVKSSETVETAVSVNRNNGATNSHEFFLVVHKDFIDQHLAAAKRDRDEVESSSKRKKYEFEWKKCCPAQHKWVGALVNSFKRIVVDGEDPVHSMMLHTTTLLALLGKEKDKSEIPCAATSGIGGSGKTELLRHLQMQWDTVANNDNDLLPEFQQAGLQKMMVVFATFNQGTSFDPTYDTTLAIQQRLVMRLGNDYFDLEKPAAAWPETLQDFVASLRESQCPKVDEKSVGVLVCVDELMKIREEETRRTLLDLLATFQQQQLQHGLPSFILVSSLQLWDVQSKWETESKRKMAPIKLPLLPVQVLKDHWMAKRHEAKQSTAWRQLVDMLCDTSGGHPRTMEWANTHLAKVVNCSDGELSLPHEIPCHPNTAEWRQIWSTCFARQILGLDTYVGISTAAQPEESGGCKNLLSGGFLTAQPVVHQYAHMMKITAIPMYFVRGGDSETEQPFCSEQVYALKSALYQLSNNEAVKSWETTMVAALALRAAAFSTVHNTNNPLLSSVLPTSTDVANIENWSVPTATRRRLVALASGVNEGDVFPPASTDDVLYRYPVSNTFPAVEGGLELQDEQGNRAVGWIQMKMYTTLNPGQLANFVADIAMFHSEYYGATPMCIMIFCTGDAKDCFFNAKNCDREELKASMMGSKDKKKYWREETFPPSLADLRVVFIGTCACKELLHPFGASSLLSKIECRQRPSTRMVNPLDGK